MVSVCIPYADTGLERARALAYVAGRYQELGYEVLIGRSSPTEWRKGEAVADAIRRASHDLLIIADGDVWSDCVESAVVAVTSGTVRWATPHWHVNRLTADSTSRYIAGDRDNLDLEEDHHGVAGGGITVMCRDTYEQAPLDPRFVGWGGEDKAWAYALRTLAGRAYRVRQPLWHLWHPPQQRATRAVGSVENDALRAAYADSSGQPRRMRELIAEGRAWASNGSLSKT